MFVKAIKEYNDLQKKRIVKKGESFEVDDARGNQLLKAGVVVQVEAPKAEKEPEEKAPEAKATETKQQKKTTKKKA